MNSIRQNIITISLVLITSSLWVLSKNSVAEIMESPLRSATQISALIGTVFLGFELVLVSKARWLELAIGPLDRLYGYHRQLSISSVLAITLHSTSLILNALPNSVLAKSYIIPTSTNLTYGAGIVSFYLFVIIVAVSIYIKLPYHIWKIMHKVLALGTLLAAYHVLTISSDISRYPVLKYWVLGTLVAGIASMLYKVVFYNIMSKKFKYIVTEVITNNDVVTIKMTTEGSNFNFHYGQFAYFSFISDKVSKEEHPFSIASTPESGIVEIAVKKSGDYTKSMDQIKVGDEVRIRGPFGHFSKNLGDFDKEIWIGAGIGISPFLSFKTNTKTKIYYCTRNEEDRSLWDRIHTSASTNGFELINHQSEKLGRLKPESLLSEFTNPEKTCVRICGPVSMLNSFKDFYDKYNLPKNNLYFEEFNYLG